MHCSHTNWRCSLLHQPIWNFFNFHTFFSCLFSIVAVCEKRCSVTSVALSRRLWHDVCGGYPIINATNFNSKTPTLCETFRSPSDYFLLTWTRFSVNCNLFFRSHYLLAAPSVRLLVPRSPAHKLISKWKQKQHKRVLGRCSNKANDSIKYPLRGITQWQRVCRLFCSDLI